MGILTVTIREPLDMQPEELSEGKFMHKQGPWLWGKGDAPEEMTKSHMKGLWKHKKGKMLVSDPSLESIMTLLLSIKKMLTL